MRLPDFYLARAGGVDFLAWNEETAAWVGHRLEVDDTNRTRIVKRRGGRGKGLAGQKSSRRAKGVLPDRQTVRHALIRPLGSRKSRFSATIATNRDQFLKWSRRRKTSLTNRLGLRATIATNFARKPAYERFFPKHPFFLSHDHTIPQNWSLGRKLKVNI